METRGQWDESCRQNVRLIAKTCNLEIFNVECLLAAAARAVRNCSYLSFLIFARKLPYVIMA
jgi:hypothetical protein